MELNDLAVEFLESIIPNYAANPKWKILFEELVNLNEVERTEMLRKLDTITGPHLLRLESDEQFTVALEFIRRSLEEPQEADEFLSPELYHDSCSRSTRWQACRADR